MQGSKNLENKDDFWISLSQQLADRNDDEETKQKKDEFYRQQKQMREQKQQLHYYDETKVLEILKSHSSNSEE